jgi:aminoglycoside phosphotransferase (APT) family kinase protein
LRQLLAGDGALTGVIDWVDVCHGDRAIDLQLVWSFLPPEARPRFFDAYGPVDDAELLRARVLALFLCATLAAYGRRARLPRVAEEAVDGLERTVADAL